MKKEREMEKKNKQKRWSGELKIAPGRLEKQADQLDDDVIVVVLFPRWKDRSR